MSDKPPNDRDSDQPALHEGAANGITPDAISRAALAILQTLQQAGFEAYVVGGGVRDTLVGLRPKDFDIATAATPQQIRALFRRSRLIGRRFVLVHVRIGRELVEVSTFRAAPSAADDTSVGVNEDGRIVRDNAYTATLAEDAKRRDFTINSLYYDPARDLIVDFSGGLDDLGARTLRIIGDPERRYQEDPVRMLRALRFAAKLGFDIARATAAPIHECGDILEGVPPSRLYEEVLKLLMSGCAERSYQLLLEYGLFGRLFPESNAIIAAEPGGFADRLTRFALADTDARVAQGKPNTAAFLFAALLWEPVWHDIRACIARGSRQRQAYDTACTDLLERQPEVLSLPRRVTMMTREIWLMQPLLEYCKSAKVEQLMNHPRFRAAYDFLLLRVKAGAQLQETAERWTHYQQNTAQPPAADQSRAAGAAGSLKPSRKRRSRRRRRSVANAKTPDASASASSASVPDPLLSAF